MSYKWLVWSFKFLWLKLKLAGRILAVFWLKLWSKVKTVYICRIQMHFGLNCLAVNTQWSRCNTLHTVPFVMRKCWSACVCAQLFVLFTTKLKYYCSKKSSWWTMLVLCSLRPWQDSHRNLLADLFDSESQTLCLFFTGHACRAHQHVPKSCVTEVSAVSKSRIKDTCTLYLFFCVFLCAHFPGQGSYADSVKITFTHEGFVLSPTFLWPDVFCLICWDKSGSETPAGVTEREHELCPSLAARGPRTHTFWISSLFCCNGTVLHPISSLRIQSFLHEMWTARNHVVIWLFAALHRMFSPREISLKLIKIALNSQWEVLSTQDNCSLFGVAVQSSCVLCADLNKTKQNFKPLLFFHSWISFSFCKFLQLDSNRRRDPFIARLLHH